MSPAEEVILLRDRVKHLEALLYGENEKPFPKEWRLTPSQGVVLRLMQKREYADRKRLFDFCYGMRPDGGPLSDKIFDVWVCQMRKRLAPFGIEIENARGRGWRLTPASKAIVGAAL